MPYPTRSPKADAERLRCQGKVIRGRGRTTGRLYVGLCVDVYQGSTGIVYSLDNQRDLCLLQPEVWKG